MTEDIKSPQFPESIFEGTLSSWLKKEGDEIKQDEVLAEIETDKVVIEEPENMGAWLMIRHKLEKVLNETKKGYKLGVIARNLSAAPAGGYQKYHQKRQKEIVTEALEL